MLVKTIIFTIVNINKMKKVGILIFLLCFIYQHDVFSQNSKKEKDFKANAAFNAGGYYEAIDLYKNAYNKIRDKNKKNEIVFKIVECYCIMGIES